MKTFKLGQPVTFTNELTRQSGDIEDFKRVDLYTWRDRKVWRVNPFIKQGEPRRGIVVGVRTLSNGDRRHVSDEGISYTPTEHFAAYLIAFDLHRKPVFVLPEHVTAVAEDGDL